MLILSETWRHTFWPFNVSRRLCLHSTLKFSCKSRGALHMCFPDWRGLRGALVAQYCQKFGTFSEVAASVIRLLELSLSQSCSAACPLAMAEISAVSSLDNKQDRRLILLCSWCESQVSWASPSQCRSLGSSVYYFHLRDRDDLRAFKAYCFLYTEDFHRRNPLLNRCLHSTRRFY